MHKSSYILILFATILLPRVISYCPQSKIQATGNCTFRMLCIGTIRDSNLPTFCNGTYRHPIGVDLYLRDAVERFDKRFKALSFLKSITTLRISATWPETDLTLLEYTSSLQNLYIIDSKIKTIHGTPFYHLENIINVDLSHNRLNNISDLFQFESEPYRFRRLTLAYNAIQELSGETFEELTSLEYLDLSYNYISDLSEEPFLNLTKLVTLKLNNNLIMDLNGAINNLGNLKHLYLQGNQIQNVDEPSLRVIYHLETFDMSGNRLNQIKPNIFTRRGYKISGICKIILADNNITSIPNAALNNDVVSRISRALRKVDVHTELDLSNNEIDMIEYNAFCYTYQMISLDLSCNNLTDFLVNPVDLKYVINLNLSSNRLTNLYYESFFSMDNLLNLDLSHNNINYIPAKTFIKNFNLKYVNLAHNNINSVDSLHMNIFNTNGGILDMSNNGLSKLSIPMSEGMRLTTLILHSNKIKDPANINLIYQNQLKALSMNRNCIEKLNKTSIRLPTSLVTLDFSFNDIKTIYPSTFNKLHRLENLNLGHNKLNSIEYGSFQGLKAATKLDLSYNSLSFLDSKVLMDLKSLEILSLQHNGLYKLDYKGWLGHRNNLKVFLEGNNYSCNWLGTALKDFNNGYSKMRPTTYSRDITTGNSIEGVPCVQKEIQSAKLELLSSELENEESVNNVEELVTDERLLATNQKILQAIKEQTYYLRSYLSKLNVNLSGMNRVVGQFTIHNNKERF